jgi:hypothetical protein
MTEGKDGGRLMVNKKGFADLITFAVIGLGMVIMFAVFIYLFGAIKTALYAAPSTATVNITRATDMSFGMIDVTGLRSLAIIIMFSMMMTVFITNYFIRAHPIFFIPYIFAVILAVILAAYISNSYQTILQDPFMQNLLVDFTGMNYILMYLPIWTTVIGIIGGILLFANIMRDRNDAGGVF